MIGDARSSGLALAGAQRARRFADLQGAVRAPFDAAAAVFAVYTPAGSAVLAGAVPAPAAEVPL